MQVNIITCSEVHLHIYTREASSLVNLKGKKKNFLDHSEHRLSEEILRE